MPFQTYTRVIDNFNRPNAPNLGPYWTATTGQSSTDRTAISGAIWSDTTQYLSISSNRAVAPTASNVTCGSMFTGIEFPPDQYAKAQIYGNGGNSANGFGIGLMIRCSIQADWIAADGLSPFPGCYGFIVCVDATPTVYLLDTSGGMAQFGQVTVSHTEGDTYEIWAINHCVTVLHNGIPIIDAAIQGDPRYMRGQPGILYMGTNTTPASVANFEAGSLPGDALWSPNLRRDNYGMYGMYGGIGPVSLIDNRRRTPNGIYAMSIQKSDMKVSAVHARPAWLRLRQTSITALLTAGTTMVASQDQLLLPVGDTSNPGNWTRPDGTTMSGLFTQLYEPSPDDRSYARSTANPSSSSYTARLGTYQQPISGPITLHTRVSSTVGTGEIDYTVQLKQGATTIQTFTHNKVSSLVYTQFDDVVTNPITDWSTPFDVVVTMNAAP